MSLKIKQKTNTGTVMGNRGEQMNYVVCLCFSETRDFYSMMLRAVAVSRGKWLAEEHLSGRINEKQFLEALLIQPSGKPQSQTQASLRL